MAFELNDSPLAVRRPWKPGPYQEACPAWIFRPDSMVVEPMEPVDETSAVVVLQAAMNKSGAKSGARVRIFFKVDPSSFVQRAKLTDI
jgi:hypothetical protein